LARVFGILLIAFIAIGISSTAHATDCQTIWDCGPRENCVGGTCLFDGLACKYDWECRPFQYCNTGVYQCALAEGRCQTDADCYGTKVCDPNFYCADKSSGGTAVKCKRASDCATGEKCTGGKCILQAASCKKSADCATGQKCTKNKCVESATATKSKSGIWDWIKSFFRIG